MEIWKCKFDKPKPTALSQKQPIFDGTTKRNAKKGLSLVTERSLQEQRTKSKHKTKNQSVKDECKKRSVPGDRKEFA